MTPRQMYFQARRRAGASCRGTSAFTLLEVMIAMALFFMATFSILAIVSNGLRNAAALRHDAPDGSVIAAMLVTTNRLEDGSFARGKFEDIAPGLYPNYSWAWEALEIATNGLFRIDILVTREGPGIGPPETRMSVLYYPPQPPQQTSFRR